MAIIVTRNCVFAFKPLQYFRSLQNLLCQYLFLRIAMSIVGECFKFSSSHFVRFLFFVYSRQNELVARGPGIVDSFILVFEVATLLYFISLNFVQ